MAAIFDERDGGGAIYDNQSAMYVPPQEKGENDWCKWTSLIARVTTVVVPLSFFLTDFCNSPYTIHIQYKIS